MSNQAVIALVATAVNMERDMAMKQIQKLHKVMLKCFICKSDKLPLDEEIAVICNLCGQEFEADTTCENNHYVCLTCGKRRRAKKLSGIVLKASRLTRIASCCRQLTAKCANAISKQGGPRCCKRDSYTTLKEVIVYCNKQFKTDFSIPNQIECWFYANNKECKGGKCQFFPLMKNS